MNENKRYDAIDGLRTFSCIGIVLMHVLANGKYNVDGFVFEKIIPSFTNLVFLFMTISAFGMCCGYYEKVINGTIKIADFYKRRYLKILPFFAVLCLLDFAIAPSINSLYEVFANLTLCFGLIPNAEITVIGVGWFLGTVFVFYLLFPFFCFLLSNKRRAWFAFAVSIAMHFVSANYFGANRKAIVFSFVFFMTGGLIYLYRDYLERKMVRYIAFVVFIAACVFYYTFSGNTLVMIVINSSLLVIGMTTEGKGVLVNGLTGFIGGISFEIYLCHMVVYRVAEKAHLLKLTGNDQVNYAISAVIVMVGAIVFAYVGKRISDFITKKCIIK